MLRSAVGMSSPEPTDAYVPFAKRAARWLPSAEEDDEDEEDMMILKYLESVSADTHSGGRRPPELEAPQRPGNKDMNEGSDAVFYRLYRMSKDTFSRLMELIEPHLPHRDPRKVEYSWQEIVLAAIHLLASGDSFFTVARAQGLKLALFDRYFDAVLRAIINGVQSTRGAPDGRDCAVAFPSSPEAVEAECRLWAMGRNEDDTRYSFLSA